MPIGGTDDRRGRWAGPLNVHLSFLIILLLACTAVPLIWLSYARGRDAAVEAAVERMQLLTERTVDRYAIVFDTASPIVTMAAVSETFLTPPDTGLERKQAALIEALGGSAYLDGIYAGYPDGTFLHAVNLDGANSPWRETLKAPAEAAFALRVVSMGPANTPVSRWRFLNTYERLLSETEPTAANYDPRTRPWYQMASTVPGKIAIGPYVTATTKMLALTIAKSHRDDGRIVIGTDILLTTIAQFLSSEKVSPRSTSYVLDATGKLIIHSNPAVMGQLLAAPEPAGDGTAADPVFDAVRAAMAGASGDERSHLRFTADGEAYIGSATTMRVSPSLEGNTLVIAAPLSDFTAESDRLLRQGLLFSGLVILIGIAATVVVANLITRSLSALTGQAARLGDLDFEQPTPAPSSISEINALATGLAVARDAIRSFALYVPRELVRKIVASSVTSGNAGREEISVLFTDIRDFTTICERTSPEDVVAMLSAYFEEINRCVEVNHGSIIQFLGDSVCAMWNAPVADPDHACHACAAALDIAATVARFNARQAELGKPELFTRIGLHTGPAVVGNVGAASRIQYTAMGDTVNVASRLEGLNKEFGTTIMVSDAVRQRCAERFVFNPLGARQAKGRSELLDLYELAGTRPAASERSAAESQQRAQPEYAGTHAGRIPNDDR